MVKETVAKSIEEEKRLSLSSDSLIDLRSLDIEETGAFAASLGFEPFRARQIWQWVHKKGVDSFSQMSDIPFKYRNILEEKAYLAPVKEIKTSKSAADDTVKMLLELKDSERIEMALMLYRRNQSRERATACLSTQTGCAMGCAFCATALCGPGRNLSCGEIVAQALRADARARQAGFAALTNVVYMGMGEPLANLNNVQKSLLLLNNPLGLNIGMRRMTISTCGLVPQIYTLADWGMQVELAISLHAPNDELRRQIMPVAAKYPLNDLLAACRYYREKTGRRITFEYALFAGVNDSLKCAQELAMLLKSGDYLLNIIPANIVPETGFFPSKVEAIRDFTNTVARYGIEVSVRESRGPDIDAACGQLRRR